MNKMMLKNEFKIIGTYNISLQGLYSHDGTARH
jgi:hypothetical protein